MKKNAGKILATMGLMLGTAACGTQISGNYTGTWTGTSNNTALTATTFAMTIYQQGSNVNGYWQATGGSVIPISGQLTGTVSSNNITATLVVPTLASSNPGPGSYLGTLTLNSGTLTGTVAGTSTTTGALSATLNLQQSR